MTKLSDLSKGALLSAGAKLLSKFIGLISTLILARLLTPSDFGIIAAISIVLYFFDVFANVATEQYIMQKKRLRISELNTAWSINVVLKSLICLLLICLSGAVASVLNKPEITTGLLVVSLVLPLNALKSSSLLQQKRMVRYQGIFALGVTEKLIAFVVVISSAILFKSFWSFIIADLVSTAAGVLLSYSWFKKSPRFTFVDWRQQLSFSGWMLGKNMVGYLRSQADTFFVSRLFSANSLGQYNLSRELAMMPGHYFLAPAIEPILSALRETVHIRDYFFQQIATALVITFFITIPIAMFLSAFAQPITLLLLGEQWDMAGLLLSCLAWLVVYWGAVYVLEISLIAQGKVKALFVFDSFSLFCIVGALIYAAAISANVSDIALYRVTTGSITTLLLFLVMYLSHKTLGFIVSMWGACVLALSLACAKFAYFTANSLVNLSEQTTLLEIVLYIATAGISFFVPLLIGLGSALFAFKETKVAAQVTTIVKTLSVGWKK